MAPSLILFVATAALWVRSYWRSDLFGWIQPVQPQADSLFIHLESGRGGLSIYAGFRSHWDGATCIRTGWLWVSDDRPPIPHAGWGRDNRWGFGYQSIRLTSVDYRWFIFPAWLPTCLFAALPLSRLGLSIRHRRRIREGHCRQCGYDLRATRHRCPECGARIPPSPAGENACSPQNGAIASGEGRGEGRSVARFPRLVALLRNDDPACATGEPPKNPEKFPRHDTENAMCCAKMIPRAHHRTVMWRTYDAAPNQPPGLRLSAPALRLARLAGHTPSPPPKPRHFSKRTQSRATKPAQI
jgi:hypothetical protein